jgi:hypothetical protein
MKDLSKQQKTAFWVMLIGFTVSFSSFLYMQGAISELNISALMVMFIIGAVGAYPIYKFVSSNKAKIEKWFD